MSPFCSHQKRKRDSLDLEDTDNDTKNVSGFDGDTNDENLKVRIKPLLKRTYNTFKKCESAVHQWCKDHGYDVVRGKASKNAKVPSKKKD